MGSCTSRHFLLSICFLQLLLVIERQVFDFLGYMWAPIFVNFFHIIFVIFGIFGAYQLRAKYIITYSVWNILWIGWNIFLICFYLNIGVLDRNSDILNIGTGSVSWFEINGYGCKPTYPTNITSEDPFRPARPERVDDCVLEYPIVEVIHSSVQCFFAVLGLLGAICIGRIFIDEDDDQFDFMGGDAKSPQHTSVHPMYVSYTSIPTSASGTMTTIKNNVLSNININTSNSSNNSKFITNNHHQTSNTNTLSSSNQNLKNSNRNSIISSTATFVTGNRRRSSASNDIRYTVVSTEKLVPGNDEYLFDEYDTNENCSLNRFKVKSKTTLAHSNDGYIPHPYPNRYPNHDHSLNESYEDNSLILNNSVNDSGDLVAENYKMPLYYITRSPNLNRVSSRRRTERPPIINFYDKIRDAPPGYVDQNIQRAKSQDRLSYRKSRHNNSRPRSFCSNDNSNN